MPRESVHAAELQQSGVAWLVTGLDRCLLKCDQHYVVQCRRIHQYWGGDRCEESCQLSRVTELQYIGIRTRKDAWSFCRPHELVFLWGQLTSPVSPIGGWALASHLNPCRMCGSTGAEENSQPNYNPWKSETTPTSTPTCAGTARVVLWGCRTALILFHLLLRKLSPAFFWIICICLQQLYWILWSISNYVGKCYCWQQLCSVELFLLCLPPYLVKMWTKSWHCFAVEFELITCL